MRIRKSLLCPDINDSTLPEQERWNRRYRTEKAGARQTPNPFISRCLARLPGGGWALDIASGGGRHSLALAQRGYTVVAMDIAGEGLRQTLRRAESKDLIVYPILVDLSLAWLPAADFDVILNVYFLERRLSPLIMRRLKPGGYLIFETYTIDQLRVMPQKRMRPEFLLRRGELRETFADFEVIEYEEKIEGDRATARLFARKPA